MWPGGGSPLETVDEEELARSGQWSSSRFGDLERFMVDFLVGGAAAGESLRLKLQTPLFVADALLEAARQQLSSELSTAQQVPPLLPRRLAPQPRLRASELLLLSRELSTGLGKNGRDPKLTTRKLPGRGKLVRLTVPMT